MVSCDANEMIPQETSVQKRKNAPSRVRFQPGRDFTPVLKQRVDDYFLENNLSKRDAPQLYLKAFIICSWAAISYALLLLVAMPWWGTLLTSLSLSFAIAGIGFSVMHDGGHKAFSKHKFVNKSMFFTLDILGGSSYYWHWKHNYLHHSFPNIHGHDDDLNVGVLGRLAPQQDHYWYHRYQQYYMWILYGFLPLKWHLWDDFYIYGSKQMLGHPIPRPKGWDLVTFFGGKLLFATFAFVLPSLIFPLANVFLFYLFVTFVEGITLATVFQMAHCVEEAEFPDKIEGTNQIDNEWFVHQIETTVDFARNNPFVSWYVGGLNFQVEHHLFPRISHVHYPAISKIVKQTCQDFGIQYRDSQSVAQSLRSHYLLLKRLGQAKSVETLPSENPA